MMKYDNDPLSMGEHPKHDVIHIDSYDKLPVKHDCCRLERMDGSLPLYVGLGESEYSHDLYAKVDLPGDEDIDDSVEPPEEDDQRSIESQGDSDEDQDPEEAEPALQEFVEETNVPTDDIEEPQSGQPQAAPPDEVAAIGIIIDAKGSCRYFRKYLTEMLGNVHKDLVELYCETERIHVNHSGLGAQAYSRVIVRLKHAERCIQGLNVYMPHTREFWLKKCHQKVIDKVSILPHLMTQLMSGHLQGTLSEEKYNAIFSETRKLVKEALAIMLYIVECHSKHDQFDVRTEFTFASEDYFNEEFQWPFPAHKGTPEEGLDQANGEFMPVLAFHHIADAVEMYDYMRQLYRQTAEPLRRFFETDSTDLVTKDYRNKDPAIVTAMLYHTETMGYFLDCLGFKGPIHEAFAMRQADRNLAVIPSWYVEKLTRRDFVTTMLSFGLKPACLKTVFRFRLEARHSRTVFMMQKIRSTAIDQIDFGYLYWEFMQMMIERMQAYCHATEKDLDLVPDFEETRGSFGFFRPINFTALAGMADARKKNLMEELGDLFMGLYDEVNFLKLNKELRVLKCAILEKPIKSTTELNCIGTPQSGFIRMAQQQLPGSLNKNEAKTVTTTGKFHFLMFFLDAPDGLSSAVRPLCHSPS